MKKIVFTFGRMNPPTIGHEKLADKIKAVAKRENADARIYLSHTQNDKKDPLPYSDKIRFAQKAFGIAHKSNAKQIFQILPELEKDGYTEIIMVVGSDRAVEFKNTLNKYNGKEYNFDKIRIVSAGQRDPDAEGVEGMSGTKLRGLAMSGDEKTFKSGLASKLSDADKTKIYNMLRKNLKEEFDADEFLNDDRDYEEEILDYILTSDEDHSELIGFLDVDEAVMTVQQRLARKRMMKRIAHKIQRGKRIRAKRMADSERLIKRSRKAAKSVLRKKFAGKLGQEYKGLSLSQKVAVDKMVDKKATPARIEKLARKLLPKVRKAEIERVKKARTSKNEEFILERQDPEIKDREGTQPAKYHSGLKKSTKVARDRQFKKGAEKHHDDPSAYPDKHAGDTGAKTKMSKHTKKYRDMFGEARRGRKSAEEAENILMGLRKAVSLKGKDIQFDNGKKSKVDDVTARKALAIYDNLRTSIEKGVFMKKLSGSPESFAAALKDPNPGKPAAKRGISLGGKFGKKANEGAVDTAKASIEREKKQDKAKFDRIMDRARLADTRAKNREESVNFPLTESADAALKKKADKSGIPVGILKQVYNRGMAAWRTGHRPGATQQQWAFARVNSFITGGKTRTTADADLWKKAKGRKEELGEEGGAGEWGTDALTKKYKSDTPGQKEDLLFSTENLSSLKTFFLKMKLKPKIEMAVRLFLKQKEQNPKIDDHQLVLRVVQDTGLPIRIGATEIKKALQKLVDTNAIPKSMYQEQALDEACCDDCENYFDHQITESEYQGRKVKLNDPFRAPAGDKKKFYVYVKNEKGNVIKLGFGDPNMEIKRDDPARRKSFRARHNCDNPGPKYKARYWSCYQWRAGAKVDN